MPIFYKKASYIYYYYIPC